MTVTVTLTMPQAAALLTEALGGSPKQGDVETYDHGRHLRDAYSAVALALEKQAHTPLPAPASAPKRGRPPGSRTRKPRQAQLPVTAALAMPVKVEGGAP